ncbi:MAG TPA: proteasome accessory factor PafA2 family protein [Candidatus Nanoarchaeia archaeon]|nr:proteasome accessory factor PafA2 family protein [Candidatus Nanoarchaeia archaeon]
MKRIMGIETEYGISGGEASSVVNAYQGKKQSHTNISRTNESIVNGLTDIGGHIGGDYGSLQDQLELYQFGTPSVHTRVSTPVISSFSFTAADDMLDNGARFYVDMGHPEYSTPECSNPKDLVIADKAGELVVGRAAKAANPEIRIFKNNSDGQGHSYGTHENYLMNRVTSDEFKERVVPALLPFFVTRQIFTGSGKIGLENAFQHGGYSSSSSTRSSPYESQRDDTFLALENLGYHFLDIPEFRDVKKILLRLCGEREQRGEQQLFQLSQRADFFTELVGLQTTYDRPLINTRDEPHADQSKYMRLHVINGDANMCEVADFLKVGTTSLVLDLIEDNVAPQVELSDPIKVFRNISRDQSRCWELDLVEGRRIIAVDVQRKYLEAAKTHYQGRDEITDELLNRWEFTLDQLDRDPMQLVGSIDWVTKLALITQIMDKNSLNLNDQKIRNAALQYHDVDRDKGLFYFLQGKGLVSRLVDDEEIETAVSTAPIDTRAYLRSRIGEIVDVKSVDWEGFTIKSKGKNVLVKIREPFSGRKEQVGQIFEGDLTLDEIVKVLSETEGIEVSDQSIFTPSVYPASKNTKYHRSKKSK